ncbi:hypothetical protein NL676_005477 [Syzygium grande]|nr:hypothetical protein NL676_005477 [Syzygium grande]
MKSLAPGVACSTMENKARWDQEGEVHCPSTMVVENSTESTRQAVDRPWKVVDRPQKAAMTETAAAVAGRLRVLLAAETRIGTVAGWRLRNRHYSLSMHHGLWECSE